MSETERIAEQLRLVFEGPSWLGPSIDILLADVREQTASMRAPAGAHTIWELVLHIAAWLRVSRERLSASELVEPTDDEDWPVPGDSWQDATTRLRSEMKALRESILAFAPERLDEVAPAREPQSFYVLLHGVIQHCAYHAGQIAILKQAIR
jgi:DinB superfamily